MGPLAHMTQELTGLCSHGPMGVGIGPVCSSVQFLIAREAHHEALLPSGSDLDDHREARAARLLRQLVDVELARPRLRLAPPRAVAPPWARGAEAAQAGWRRGSRGGGSGGSWRRGNRH